MLISFAFCIEKVLRKSSWNFVVVVFDSQKERKEEENNVQSYEKCFFLLWGPAAMLKQQHPKFTMGYAIFGVSNVRCCVSPALLSL